MNSKNRKQKKSDSTARNVRATVKSQKVANETRREAPIKWIAQSMRSIKIRSIASGAFIDQISYTELAAQIGIIATGSTSSVFIPSMFRLVEIEVWGPLATAGATTTCSLTWVNTSSSFETPPITYSDSSVSFDHPSYLRCKPPFGSEASKWHYASNTDIVVDLRCPNGSTVDITYEFIIADAETILAQLTGPTIAGATNGRIYHRLIPGATGTLIPTGPLNQL